MHKFKARYIDLGIIFQFENQISDIKPIAFSVSLTHYGLMHEPQKSTSADSIWKMSQCQRTALPIDIQYVLDGGALLQRIPWNKGSTFSEILKTYSDYVLNKYG